MTRLVGPQNLLLWIGLYPERFGRFIERTNEWAWVVESSDQGG